MKESIGYTVTLNIVIVFITIIMAFLFAALIYFKSNKVSNIITETIEKYEGYNDSSISEIKRKLVDIGYGSHAVGCYEDGVEDKTDFNLNCHLTSNSAGRGSNGYCVYVCIEDAEGLDDAEYYFYKISTNMMVNIPIMNDIIDIPIYSNTNRLYNFNK